MELTVNGKKHEHKGEGTLAELLREIGANPENVAVMVNNAVARRSERDSVKLKPGDSVEVVAFVGGGTGE